MTLLLPRAWNRMPGSCVIGEKSTHWTTTPHWNKFSFLARCNYIFLSCFVRTALFTGKVINVLQKQDFVSFLSVTAYALLRELVLWLQRISRKDMDERKTNVQYILQNFTCLCSIPNGPCTGSGPKKIKDSPNSQAVPKILSSSFKKWHCLVPHWLRFLLFLQYSTAWLVSPSWLYQILWDSLQTELKKTNG